MVKEQGTVAASRGVGGYGEQHCRRRGRVGRKVGVRREHRRIMAVLLISDADVFGPLVESLY